MDLRFEGVTGEEVEDRGCLSNDNVEVFVDGGRDDRPVLAGGSGSGRSSMEKMERSSPFHISPH